MSTLGKIVYLSEAQASELFANGSITVDGTTITYSANDLYLTPENAEYVNKSGDTMTGALKAKGLRTYVSDTAGNASLNFGETADSTRVGRITMNTTTSRMEFDEENERYFLPAPTAASVTSYDIITTNGSYTLGGQLNTPGINSYSSSWPGFGFALSSDPTTNLASLNYDNTNKCFTFVSPSNDGTDTTESFSLPQETLTDGNWHNYAILTSKTAVTVAQGGTGATTAADALTNLGAVNKAGDTMTGTLKSPGISLYNSSWPQLSFLSASTDSTATNAVWSDISKARMGFSERASGSSYNEEYILPIPNVQTERKWYSILTSKTAVTVAQGGTGSTTAAGALTNLGALPLAGGTMTGQIVLSSTGFKTSNASGYSVNAYGNFTHTDTSTTSSWNICKNSGAGVFTVNFENGNTTVGGTLTVASSIQATNDIYLKGSTAPMLHLRRSDGTELGSLYGLVSSSRLILRTWNSTGTYYADYQLPDDSANDGFRSYNILTSKDFKYSSVNQTSGTLTGFVGSGAGVWIVSVYDSADAAKYWIGTINKKSGENPVVATIANATISAPWGNTIGTIVFSGATGNYVAQGIKIV